jgi:hypothetical protein
VGDHATVRREEVRVDGRGSGVSGDGPADRRHPLRYERSARLFTAFLTLAATLLCYKKFAT